jgi:hypothetical protein
MRGGEWATRRWVGYRVQSSHLLAARGRRAAAGGTADGRPATGGRRARANGRAPTRASLATPAARHGPGRARGGRRRGLGPARGAPARRGRCHAPARRPRSPPPPLRCIAAHLVARGLRTAPRVGGRGRRLGLHRGHARGGGGAGERGPWAGRAGGAAGAPPRRGVCEGVRRRTLLSTGMLAVTHARHQRPPKTQGHGRFTRGRLGVGEGGVGVSAREARVRARAAPRKRAARPPRVRVGLNDLGVE